MTGLKLYRPSNGTEGLYFRARFCDQCERDREYMGTGEGEGCPIYGATLVFDVDDPHYPREWRRDKDGKPTCTAFVPLGGQVPTDRDLEAAGQLNLLEAA